ncbi:MAG: S41 family peptidase [Flavobacterium sp.]|nr:S41 family peptidase [Flavobacterium sp.]
MNKFFFAILALVAVSCSSMKNQNKHLNDDISVTKLKADVDFIQTKFVEMHPDLYWYISKKDLDFKFDSIKTTLVKPISSYEFYEKITPVIVSIRQGHMTVQPQVKLFTKKEGLLLAKKGVGPLSQFEFECFNDKLIVTKNKSYNKSIVIGTEIKAINGENVTSILNRYKKLFTSDGFNTTFKTNRVGRNFGLFYTYEHGIKDSLKYDFVKNDSLKSVTILRKVVDTTGKNSKKKILRLSHIEKRKKKVLAKLLEKRKNIYGYNSALKIYNRNLKFIDKDSAVAVIKLNGFQIGDYETFYKESFEKIKKYNTKTLVIDLRNNGGGRLSEIAELYSYLATSSFTFSGKTIVTSKTSLFQADYFKGVSLPNKLIRLVGFPFYAGFIYFSIHQSADGTFYYASPDDKVQKVKPNAFGGKIYVLINGGSFSASCILSSNLKGSSRATFVGEETGGAYNGCVAGRMPQVKLPNSKIKVRVGLMKIVPYFTTKNEGRGIFPDKEIIPSLQDRISGNNPEMNWILQDCKSVK